MDPCADGYAVRRYGYPIGDTSAYADPVDHHGDTDQYAAPQADRDSDPHPVPDRDADSHCHAHVGPDADAVDHRGYPSGGPNQDRDCHPGTHAGANSHLATASNRYPAPNSYSQAVACAVTGAAQPYASVDKGVGA